MTAGIPPMRRIEHADDADEQSGHAIVPAEDDAHHDGGRIERESHRRAALDQKDDAGEGARFSVEAPFEVFVSRVNAGLVKNGHRGAARITMAIGRPK